MNDAKKVEDSRVETFHIVKPNDLNPAGRLFGGALMQWIDEVAGLVALRHTGMNVTTASVDDLHFLQSAYLSDIVVLVGRATYVGNTSMEIRVDTYVETKDGMRKPINRAYATVVALDENDKPTPVPRLIIEGPSQQMEWEGAKKKKGNAGHAPKGRILGPSFFRPVFLHGLHHLYHAVNLLLFLTGFSFL